MLPLNVLFYHCCSIAQSPRKHTFLLEWTELSSLKRLLGQPCFQFDESLSEKRQGHTEDVLADWISRANKNELLFKLNIIFKKWGQSALNAEISTDPERWIFCGYTSFVLFIFLYQAVCSSALKLVERLSTLSLASHRDMETWDWIPGE